MIKSILVPLDGSPFSEQALPWAACLAKATGAHLEMVRVHDPVPAWTIATEGAVAATAVDQSIRDGEEQYLANCAARLEEGGFTGITRQLLDGDVVDQIAAHAEDNAFGLVVLATHGRGALSRLWLGSVSDALVRRLTVPVLLIRPAEGTTIPPAEQFRKVFVALDGSTESESAIGPALALADPKRCEVVLLRVVPPIPIAGEAGMGA
jgi:nucleotide-binding universal stress UspA family protein